MAPLSHIFSLISLFRRAPSGIEPYMIVPAEQASVCRMYADDLSEFSWQFRKGTPLNISCWTETTMKDTVGSNGDPPSYIWLWMLTNETFGWDGPGVGNTDQGGIASGKGCWLHEDDVADAGDVYFPERVRYCGDAPHHQVGSPADSTVYFQCRNCTDLSKPACNKTYETEFPGNTDVGCWTNGTAVNGNSTWVKLIEPPSVNCYISPDQFDPVGWHGLPAGKCEERPWG